jgi:hypothetical protein
MLERTSFQQMVLDQLYDYKQTVFIQTTRKKHKQKECNIEHRL